MKRILLSLALMIAVSVASAQDARTGASQVAPAKQKVEKKKDCCKDAKTEGAEAKACCKDAAAKKCDKQKGECKGAKKCDKKKAKSSDNQSCCKDADKAKKVAETNK